MAHPLSKKQLEVLKALESFARTREHIPSVRELAARLKKSPTTVFQHLKALERRGYLKGDGSAHGWQLLPGHAAAALASDDGTALERSAEGEQHVAEPGAMASRPAAAAAPRLVREDGGGAPDWVRVRIAGTIAAGAPIEAMEDRDESTLFPRELVPADAYALRVRGNSMIEDHICDGDLVLVRPQATVHDGEIAVALLEDGSATLKRLYRERGRVRLQPANSSMQPIFAADVRVQGRVVGVWRHCD